MQHVGSKNWWQRYSPFAIIGLAGVSKHESRRARFLGRVFSYLAVIVSVILLCQWQLILLGRISWQQNILIDFVAWLYFLVNLSFMLFLVNNKLRFLRENWLLFVLVLAIVPFVVEPSLVSKLLIPLRPFLAIYIMIPTFSIIRDFLIDGKLRTTLLAAALIIVFFGLLVSGIDPSVKTPWDGLWWALSTISTVGYGDVVPTSALGRLLGTALVVLGLGVFVVITANFLAIFLQKNVKPNLREYNLNIDKLQVQQQLDDLYSQQDKILKAIQQINESIKDKGK